MIYRFLFKLIMVVIILSMLTACQPAAEPEISIDLALGEATPGTTAGAMFMRIKNTGNAPDKLISGTSPACGSIEIHEMVMKSDGTMGMNLIDKPLEIPANDQVELVNGGLHIMCILMNEQFEPGAKIDLTLTFEKSGEKTTSVLIQN